MVGHRRASKKQLGVSRCHTLSEVNARLCAATCFRGCFWSVATCAATSPCLAILLGSWQVLTPSCVARPPWTAAPPPRRKTHTHPSPASVARVPHTHPTCRRSQGRTTTSSVCPTYVLSSGRLNSRPGVLSPPNNGQNTLFLQAVMRSRSDFYHKYVIADETPRFLPHST